jgi:hypothetical protein
MTHLVKDGLRRTIDTTSPSFVSEYKGKADLNLINQFWRTVASGTLASEPVKEAPKLNLVGSKLFARRAKVAAAKAAEAGGCCS